MVMLVLIVAGTTTVIGIVFVIVIITEITILLHGHRSARTAKAVRCAGPRVGFTQV